MLSKNEYFYLKVKLDKKRLAISNFELNDPLYSQFIELVNSGHDEYTKRVKIWNKYYQDVQASPIGLLLKEMSQVTKRDVDRKVSEDTRKRICEIMDASENAKNETNKSITKPTFEDPLFIMYKISGYKKTVAETKEIELILAEYRDVYEKQKDKADFSI